MGDGLTPAVQTMVSARKVSPSESRTSPSTHDSIRVSSRMSMPRFCSWRAAYAPISGPTSGRIRFDASTSTKRTSSCSSSG